MIGSPESPPSPLNPSDSFVPLLMLPSLAGQTVLCNTDTDTQSLAPFCDLTHDSRAFIVFPGIESQVFPFVC